MGYFDTDKVCKLHWRPSTNFYFGQWSTDDHSSVSFEPWNFPKCAENFPTFSKMKAKQARERKKERRKWLIFCFQSHQEEDLSDPDLQDEESGEELLQQPLQGNTHSSSDNAAAQAGTPTPLAHLNSLMNAHHPHFLAKLKMEVSRKRTSFQSFSLVSSLLFSFFVFFSFYSRSSLNIASYSIANDSFAVSINKKDSSNMYFFFFRKISRLSLIRFELSASVVSRRFFSLKRNVLLHGSMLSVALYTSLNHLKLSIWQGNIPKFELILIFWLRKCSFRKILDNRRCWTKGWKLPSNLGSSLRNIFCHKYLGN